MRTKISIRNKSYNIEISKIKENLFKVKVEDENYFFIQDRSGSLILLERKDYPTFDIKEKIEVIPNLPQQKEVRTPIAGIVSKIYIKEGDIVKPGSPVVTLMAMKMENEIISESHGKVKNIKIKEKQFVNAEEVLMTLE